MYLCLMNARHHGGCAGGTLVPLILRAPTELDEDELVSIDAEVDRRCRDDRRSRESLEAGVEENEELRVGVCTGEVCACRLRPLRRGNRIFRDGVVGAVTVVVGSGERGVEGALTGAERGGDCWTTVDEAFMTVGLSGEIDPFGFLDRRLR